MLLLKTPHTLLGVGIINIACANNMIPIVANAKRV